MKKMPADRTAALKAFERVRAEARRHSREPTAYFLGKADVEAGLGSPAAIHSMPPLTRHEMRSELVALSRQLARVLRHKPDLWSVTLDAQGWCEVAALMAGAAKAGQALTADELHEIVATNDKQRFRLSADGLRIRAVQGHSVRVDLKLLTVLPPPALYHGTVRKFLEAIRREGLRPMNRHAVHLSATREAAVAVGSRRGVAVVLVVDSYAMNRDGYKFQQAENGTWLADAVPPQYLKLSAPNPKCRPSST